MLGPSLKDMEYGKRANQFENKKASILDDN